MSEGIDPQMPHPGRTTQRQRATQSDPELRSIRFLTEQHTHEFGARLRARRQQLGLPIEEVASASGLTPRDVVAVEAGVETLTVGALGWLALALRVRSADLLGGLGYYFD